MSERQPEQSDKFTWGAEDVIASQCSYCVHLARGGAAAGVPAYCKAFPGGVPGPILRNERSHLAPWIDPATGEPGDRGVDLAGSIVFNPRPGTDPGQLERLRKLLAD